MEQSPLARLGAPRHPHDPPHLRPALQHRALGRFKFSHGYDLLSTDPNPNHVTLKWADGTPSGFSIVCLPAPGPQATVAILHSRLGQALTGPPLTIQRDGSGLRISWPAAYHCFELQQANQLPAPSWSPVSPLPGLIGEEYVVTVAVPQGHKFYRLHKP